MLERQTTVAQLTPDDLIDLSRWHAIQFRDRATAEAATDRFRLYRERQRAREGQPEDRGRGETPQRPAA
jgi:hypothetical protein